MMGSLGRRGTSAASIQKSYATLPATPGGGGGGGDGGPSDYDPGGTGTLLMNGDYSTNNFSQWSYIENEYYQGVPSGYTSPVYSLGLTDDAIYGKAARFEVRSGDSPFLGTERSEVLDFSDNRTGGDFDGDVRWYRFATKFDATYPTNAASWGLVNQWHDPNGSTFGSPLIVWSPDQNNGYFSLVYQRQQPGGVYLGNVTLWQTPLARGTWHEIKMQICWSANNAIGTQRLWYRQGGGSWQRQQFTGGVWVWTERTLGDGGPGVYYKEGRYRSPDADTDVVYHAGFRCATSEAALGAP